MPTFIEVIDPYAGLTRAERDDLMRLLSAAPGRRWPVGLSERDLRRHYAEYAPGLTGRSLVRGYRVYEKLERNRGLAGPVPPPPRAWLVWYLRESGWKYERIIAQGSPALRRPAPDVQPALNARTLGARHQQALGLVKAVRAFKAACQRAGRGWYFGLMADIMTSRYAEDRDSDV